MESLTLIVLVILSAPLVVIGEYENIPDYELRLEERVRKHGYPIEVHQLITEDGYILAAYHIPHGSKKEEPENKNKSIVLIVHGMGGSPHNFIVLGKQRGSPYYFADRGYDVWLFSSRASDTPFEKHVKLDWNKDSEFWLHSFHEIGKYDLASTIDYILNYTGQEKVTLIGHSAGGNECFALLSEKPEYNRKIKLIIAWGSSPILKRLDYPMMQLGIHLGDVVKTIVKYLRMAELVPFVNQLRADIVALSLKNDPFWYNFFKFSISNVGSHNSVLTLDEYIPVILSNIPRMASRQIIHFIDNVYHGTFRKFDFGPKGNLKRYGQIDPPHYNLSATTVPTAFFNGQMDGEVQLEDIYEAMETIPNTVFLYRIPFARFTHTDYIFGYNASELVYEPTYQLMKDIDKGIIPAPIKPPSDYNKLFKI